MLDRVVPPPDPAVPLANEARSLADLFLRRAAATPTAVAWKAKKNGEWRSTTWAEFKARAMALATFLAKRGLAPGDKIGIVGSTRPEWCICDVGGQLAAVVTVGAYPTLAPGQLAYVLDHADVRVVFVEGKDEVEKILAVKHEVPKLELVVVWDTRGLEETLRQHAWLMGWDEALEAPGDASLVAARVEAIDPDDTALFIYTSGTTGPPKGAMISHRNILVTLGGVHFNAFSRSDISLSFLPMAHAAERILAFWGRIDFGIATAYATSVPAVLEELKEVRPTLFGSVPRIFEKAYARIQTEVDKAPPARKKVFRWAESAALVVVEAWQRGDEPSLPARLAHRVADKLVFSRVREVFGGRVKRFITGAAPIPRPILAFFWAAGLPIYEMYGMTEATVVTHGNRPDQVRLGSVGRALPFVEDKIAEDGEILVRGPNVFKGYYKNPEATREMIDEEGWLHTGDIGRKDADGFVFIVDRKKHLIITSGGKNISPANVENEIKASDTFISQVHAHGDRRPYCTAIVTIHPLEAVEWAKARGHLGDAQADALRRALLASPLSRPPGLAPVMEKATTDPEVQKRIASAVRRANTKLARVEGIKRIHLLERDFSLEEDEVTPTLKVKRKTIEKKFAQVFDRLYEDPGFGILIEEE
ncbi:AMP-dependent synthetase/ligase [Polyangium sorediatum]|uniref:Long-chain fatty acid--CoA ligase n=1 Tax=Polyangium sorediatum TaxID=889274 RepID=A0ABT6P813_9BACT|nr:long-chain fatty acid--CoA ligase [Polyangium sorediatum]MDI1436753.1 long-chain fatty acid--CoA ligase [Polyangium sorediatum]